MVSEMSNSLPNFQGIKNWIFSNLKILYHNLDIQGRGKVTIYETRKFDFIFRVNLGIFKISDFQLNFQGIKNWNFSNFSTLPGP